MSKEITAVHGTVLDESIRLSLGELCRSCAVSAEFIIEMVEEGVVEPSGERPEQWRFTGNSVRRVQRAVRLSRDLRVNLPGVALALDLMDELEKLRRQQRRYSRFADKE